MFKRWKLKQLRKQAVKFGIPFWDPKFWPVYPLSSPTALLHGKVIPENYDLYDALIGDVVPVLRFEGHTHYYRLEGLSWLPGDDHAASPKLFNIQYHHSVREVVV